VRSESRSVMHHGSVRLEGEAFDFPLRVGMKILPVDYSPHRTQTTVFIQLYPGQKIEKFCMSVLQPIIFAALQWLNNHKEKFPSLRIGEVHRPWKHLHSEEPRKCRKRMLIWKASPARLAACVMLETC
jgi:hypothetical protein